MTKWAKYANDSFAQSVFLNLICHFTCILEFPHPAFLLYLPVALQGPYLFGRENSHFPEANFGYVQQCSMNSVATPMIFEQPTSTTFGREKACLPGQKQTTVNWQNLAVRSNHAIAGPKEM